MLNSPKNLNALTIDPEANLVDDGLRVGHDSVLGAALKLIVLYPVYITGRLHTILYKY